MLGTDICFDIGTCNMAMWAEGRGIVMSEPSVAAYDAQTGKISAIGRKAYEMTGRNPDWIDVVRPVKDGSIYNFQTVQSILSYYVQKICGSRMLKPNILLCVPGYANTVDRRTLIDLATASGASRACVVEEPLAAALGAGIDVNSSKGIVVVDIGGGTTDMSVISKGMVCVSRSVKIAGNSFDDAIINFLRKEKGVSVGRLTAENIKKEVGCTSFLEAEIAVRVVGKDIVSGLPVETEMSSAEVFTSIRELLETVTEEIRLMLETTPPELIADISENGIVITGGSANLTGIEKFVEYRLGIPSSVAPEPEKCVITGLAKLTKARTLLERNACFYKTRQELGYDEF